ncbi:hypothetical protein E1A91_D08G267300v1 [Gossypium mustelinum]|uniref:J domain-containing protein n=1 Tax=Gossypium mustelinum TaxID=34275 RepID=A0A5D2U0H4_GOSMU|nr:hypothetical protein E1A91_D08G267300v1 [Gossypium mustelinum]
MEGNHNSTPKDYYKILEVEYDATDEKIRLNYRKLALKWHPDKHKGDSSVTAKFQEINEAYNVLIDPDKRFEYDITGIYEIDKYTLREYLARFKGMTLTCNGLGIPHTSIWTQQLRETNEYADDEKVQLFEPFWKSVIHRESTDPSTGQYYLQLGLPLDSRKSSSA